VIVDFPIEPEPFFATKNSTGASCGGCRVTPPQETRRGQR
jgi:hypothetical protein